MRPFTRLEDEPKSFSIFGEFISATTLKKFPLNYKTNNFQSLFIFMA